jgi:hypothetical protein
MKSKAHNGAVRSSEKDFKTLQLGAFAAPGLLLAQVPGFGFISSRDRVRVDSHKDAKAATKNKLVISTKGRNLS